MEDRGQIIYHEVLESMQDGVMVIAFNGVLELVNAAFCQTFDLNRDDIIGRTFAEVFLEFEGYEEFSQIVLDSTLHQAASKRQIVNVDTGDLVRSIAVTTSSIAEVRSGRSERLAIVVVFSDITEIREFREQELQLAKKLELQHRKLQKAYKDIESRNVDLSTALKKVRFVRLSSILVAVVLFVGAGAYYLRFFDTSGFQPLNNLVKSLASEEQSLPAPSGRQEVRTMQVEARPFNSSITLRGFLAPGKIEGVISPIESNISVVHVRHGEQVSKGDPLVTLNTEKISIEFRQAEIDYIKKLKRLDELRDWENSKEMADARRRFQSARISLNTAKRRLDRVAFLLEEGIIPASEHESAQQQHDSQLLDFEAAQDAFESIRSQGNDDARRVALLEAENSKSRLDDIRGKIANSTIKAPISGLVQPATGKDTGPLTSGRPLSTGELLLTIANFEQIVVETTVDEVDVNKIKPNQAAWISGPGFPDERLEGSVRHVASKTRFQARHGSSPQFQITVELSALNPFQRERLRVGMSAHVTIVTYSNSQAVMVPLESVQQFGNAARIRVMDPSGNIEERIVETGLTTLDSVEVLHGLDIGEQIVLSGN